MWLYGLWYYNEVGVGKPGLSECSVAGISEAVDNHAIEQMEHALRYVHMKCVHGDIDLHSFIPQL